MAQRRRLRSFQTRCLLRDFSFAGCSVAMLIHFAAIVRCRRWRYQAWDSFGPDDAARLIDDQRDREPGMPGTWFQAAIVEKVTDSMVGDCCLHRRLDDPRQMEFGITLAPSHQGRGYATEALGCLLHFVFATLGKHRVSAVTDVENHAAELLFRRLGFRQEAHHIEHRWYKGYWDSEFVFALLRREWELLSHPSQEFAR